MRHGHHAALKFCEASQGHVSQGCQDAAHKCEGYRFHAVLFRARHQEVCICKDCSVCFFEAGRAFNLFRCSAALDFYAKEFFRKVLLCTFRGKKINPDYIVNIETVERRLRLGNHQFSVIPVEDRYHFLFLLSRVSPALGRHPVAPSG